MNESAPVAVEEQVVLHKFEGDPIPENEFERLVVVNGEAIEHNRIENGEVVGPVEEGNLVGTFLGHLLPENVQKLNQDIKEVE